MKFDGERLKLARKNRKLTMEALGNELNNDYGMSVNKSMMSKWENNHVTPRYDTIDAISDILGLEFDFLMGDNTIASLLHELRFKKGLTTLELIQQANLDEGNYQSIENGFGYPSEKTLIKLGEFYGIEDFISYLGKRGSKIITIEQMAKIVQENLTGNQKSFDSSFEHKKDLFRLLNEDNSLYYKDKPISNDDRIKILTMLDLLLR